MLARLSALVVWALVAATAVFWGLRLGVRATVLPGNAVTVADAGAPRGDLARLLGAPQVEAAAAAVAPDAASRFRLLGVMAPKASAARGPRRQGVALIAVDGKPPRAYVVGSALDGELVLQSVSLRSASIGPARGDQALKLELPPLPPASTGTLPGILSGPAPVPLRGMAPALPPSGVVIPPQLQLAPQRALNPDAAVQRDPVSGASTE